MGDFKKFLKENEDTLQQIYDILGDLSDEELNEFGEVLYNEFLDSDEEFDEEDFYDIDDVKDMVKELSPESYDDILDLLEVEEFEGAGASFDGYEETDGKEYRSSDVYEGDDSESVDERVARIMKNKDRNKKKRKFQKKTVSQLRRGKSQRKVQARKDKPKKKKYFRKNKVKIKAYKASRSKAIKSGKHHVKIRRK